MIAPRKTAIFSLQKEWWASAWSASGAQPSVVQHLKFRPHCDYFYAGDNRKLLCYCIDRQLVFVEKEIDKSRKAEMKAVDLLTSLPIYLCLRGRSVARIGGSAARISAICSQRRCISAYGLTLFSRRNRRATLRGWRLLRRKNTPASRHKGRASLRVRLFCCVCLRFSMLLVLNIAISLIQIR